MLLINEVRVWSNLELTFLEMLFGRRCELSSDKLEAALLEAGDDIANETTVNTIRLEESLAQWAITPRGDKWLP